MNVPIVSMKRCVTNDDIVTILESSITTVVGDVNRFRYGDTDVETASRLCNIRLPSDSINSIKY